MRYLLPPAKTLIVRGPSSLQLLSGNATVLGAPLDGQRRLVVRKEKQLPVEAHSEVQLEIQSGEEGSVQEVEGSTIPRSWEETADALAEMGQGSAAVIGATDVGKSTLCVYLTNRLLGKGVSIRLVDADIGQADLGPPTTAGRATPKNFLSTLVDLKPEALLFIGDTSPGRVVSKLIEAIQRLVKPGFDGITIVNTDGWVLDPEAIFYKIDLLTRINPELVVGISTQHELDAILSASSMKSIKVEASPAVLPRSRDDRRELREAGYRKYLEGGATRTFPLRRIRIAVPRSLPPIERWQAKQFGNLILGLLDDEGYLVQIGVLLELDGDHLTVHSKAAEGVRTIELGYVRLSTDGTELGYLEI